MWLFCNEAMMHSDVVALALTTHPHLHAEILKWEVHSSKQIDADPDPGE